MLTDSSCSLTSRDQDCRKYSKRDRCILLRSTYRDLRFSKYSLLYPNPTTYSRNSLGVLCIYLVTRLKLKDQRLYFPKNQSSKSLCTELLQLNHLRMKMKYLA